MRDSKIDTTRFTDVGQVGKFDRQSQVESFISAWKEMVTLNIAKVNDELGKDARTSFVAIEPGDYVVTWAACDYGNRRSWMGADHPTLLSVETGTIIPVLGANRISVRPGQIVDGGVLEIRKVEKASFFSSQTAYLVGQPTPPEFRQRFSEALPELYKRLTFTQFTSAGAPVPSAGR